MNMYACKVKGDPTCYPTPHSHRFSMKSDAFYHALILFYFTQKNEFFSGLLNLECRS